MMLKGKRATYARFVGKYQPQKEEPYRVRLPAKVNIINCPHKVSTPTAGLTTVKTLLNSTISMQGATFMTTDIK